MGYKVKLNIFEGPFDLLVYLIENARMSIYDIQIAEITSRYLEYIDEMKKQDISVSTEFIVLAAALIEIKSKLLLPRANPDMAGSAEEDPRNELVERLLEYKKFKNAAAALEEAEERAMRIFEKPKEDISRYTEHPDEYLKMDIAQFVKAFNLFLHRKQKLEEMRRRYTRIERQRITSEQKMEYIRAYFSRMHRRQATFDELIEDEHSRYNAAVTFSSILEMAKSKEVGLTQKKNFDEIIITDLEREEAQGIDVK